MQCSSGAAGGGLRVAGLAQGPHAMLAGWAFVAGCRSASHKLQHGRTGCLLTTYARPLRGDLSCPRCSPAPVGPAAEEGRAAALLSQQLVRIETGLDLPPVQEPLDQLR